MAKKNISALLVDRVNSVLKKTSMEPILYE